MAPHRLGRIAAGCSLLVLAAAPLQGQARSAPLRRETQLPVDQALRIAREVTEPLACAHARKIVHRVIKPANVMLSAGHAKALDLLEPVVRIPYLLTPEYMRIDPNFAPLRGNPRFEKLLRSE